MHFYLNDDDFNNIENKDEIIANSHFKGIITSKIVNNLDVNQLQFEGNNILDSNFSIIGKVIEISTPEDMEQALNSEFDQIEIIYIKTGDWHIIPIENLIAKFSNLDINLVASARSPMDIKLLENILEKGISSCILIPNDNYSIQELIQEIEHQKLLLKLSEFEISDIRKIGLGDRVCVDTCSILQHNEGMLVGSTSTLFVLVEAEVNESGFVNSRPFRVNAGVIASYSLNFEKTNYLSEYKAGSEIMIVNNNGEIKKEIVARVKIERRPLILIEFNYNNRNFPVILQDAETVRLVTSSGSLQVNELKIGDKILGYISEAARHFGMQVDEFLEEK